jgi:uncharacterized protein YjbI with pentapeptide repeats
LYSVNINTYQADINKELQNYLQSLDKKSKEYQSKLALYGADLQGADLRGADLFYSDLRNTDLSNANLSGVNLRHSNFEGAILNNTDFTGANYDSHTLDTIPKNDRDSLKKQGKLW